VPELLRARRQLTRRYGAAYPAGQPLFPMRGGMNLVFTARELQPNSPLIDQTFRFVGPSINPQARGADAPFEVPGQGPLVYISLGTVHSAHAAQAEFYRRCFAAFSDYPARFVLAAGRQIDIGALGPAPANFTVRPAVPQLAVLERAELFITHGGINSMHEGLYYGVPLILIPQQFERSLRRGPRRRSDPRRAAAGPPCDGRAPALVAGAGDGRAGIPGRGQARAGDAPRHGRLLRRRR
jgi:MGT family glycosyltransferase